MWLMNAITAWLCAGAERWRNNILGTLQPSRMVRQRARQRRVGGARKREQQM